MQFDLVTPEKLLVSCEASEIIVSGSEGHFGVLDGHQPLLSSLKPGKLEVTGMEGTQTYYVGFGFADIRPDKVTVLAEEACPIDSLENEKIHNALQTLKDKMFSAEGAETEALEKRQQALEAQLSLLS